MSTIMELTSGLALTLYLAACGSSPTNNLYRLTSPITPTGGDQQPSLGIGPIDIAEFLNRDALVYSRGGNQLQAQSYERWAEPLVDGVERVMGVNLAQLMRSQNLLFFPWDMHHAPDYGIRISVIDLDADDEQAILVADWLLYRPRDGSTITRRISNFKEPLAGEQLAAADLPAAYSALLFQLSETIAKAIREEEQKVAQATNSDGEAGN